MGGFFVAMLRMHCGRKGTEEDAEDDFIIYYELQTEYFRGNWQYATHQVK